MLYTCPAADHSRCIKGETKIKEDPCDGILQDKKNPRCVSSTAGSMSDEESTVVVIKRKVVEKGIVPAR